MKTTISKKMIGVVAVFVAVLTTHGATYNLTGLSGSGSIEYYNYYNNRHDYFIINTGTFQPISIQYDMALHYSDVVKVYCVKNNGEDSLIQQITGFIPGTISTVSPSGRAKIEFISDASISYNFGEYPSLTGFSFNYSAQPFTFSNNIITSGNASIAGNLGVGFSNPSTRLHVNGPIRGNGAAGSLTVNTTYGNVTMGATSSSQATISTDRSYFQFDKPVYLSTGVVNSITSTLQLKTNNVPRLTILNSTGCVGLGIEIPTQALSVKGNLSLSPLDTTPVESHSGSLMITKPAASGQYINIVRSSIMPWSIGMVYNTSFFAIGQGRTPDSAFNNPPFVINPNGKVVIGGFLDSDAQLHIASGSGDGIRIGKTGDAGTLNVPIDSLTAQYNLDFSGFRDVAPNQIGARIAALRFNNHVENNALVQKTGLSFQTNPTGLYEGATGLQERLRITPEGNVGIGTSNPQYLLDVKGIIRAMEIKVEPIGQFADFVFAEDYSLPTLKDVDGFIQTNGHLPNVPSASEVKEKGLNLVEMQIRLLQKIEELTLYTIE